MERNQLEYTFLSVIRQYKIIGYGNMMDIISREWYQELETEYGSGAGVGTFIVGQALGTLPEKEQADYLDALHADPLFIELDWQKAESHLNVCLKAYKELVGRPQVNPFFALGLLAALQQRFERGERTIELYNEIMEFEL
jgi:hypothetical protein